MKKNPIVRCMAIAVLLAAAPQPASAQLFGDGPNIFCSLLTIGCPPPPPPPPPLPPAPPPEPMAPAPKAHKAHKAHKAKPALKATVAPKAADTPQ